VPIVEYAAALDESKRRYGELGRAPAA
jgi:hypothetical protein